MNRIYFILITCLFLYYIFYNFENFENQNEQYILHVQLMGGLGNRLFQIASGYSISKKNNMILKIKNDDIHNYDYIDFVTQNLDNMFKNISHKTYDDSQEFITYHEKEEFKYNDITIDQNKPTILHGFFQSEQYFKDYRLDILEIFKEPQHISNLLNNITNFDNLVAIHIRLGDFLLYDKHFIDLTEYYKTAINLAKNNINNNDIQFVIISEEPPEKIKEHYPFLNDNHTTYQFKEKNSPEYDLFFMSRCRGVICPNSTFAWWGAWLNKRTHKFITLPKNFINTTHSTIPMDYAIII